MKRIFVFTIVISLFSCGEPTKKAPPATDSPVTTVKETPPLQKHRTMTCQKLLEDVIKSSDALAYKHFNRDTVQSRLTSMSADKASITLYVLQNVSDNPAEKRMTEHTVGWLEFYKQTGKLMDITNDPNRPLELQYDKTILQGHDLFRLCDAETAIAKPGTGYEQKDVMLEKDILFNGKVKRLFTLAEFKQVFGKPDSIKLLKDEAPCNTIFNTEAPDDKYLYKNGTRFETSKDKVAVDEFWFKSRNFITYKGIKIDATTTINDMKKLFPGAVMGKLNEYREGELWLMKLKEDKAGISDGHIKLFFKNGKVCFMHWWFPC